MTNQRVSPNQAASPKVKRRSRRKNGVKRTEVVKDGDVNSSITQVHSVFCPECQGTGMNIQGEELEKPRIALSQVCIFWKINFLSFTFSSCFSGTYFSFLATMLSVE